MTQTEPFLQELAREFLEPLLETSPFTSSRLAVLPDGLTYPVLRILAVRKFGRWTSDYFPYWIDGNPHNEVLSNVDLAVRPHVTRRKLGIPAGPDYRRRWRLINQVRKRQLRAEGR